MSLPRCQFFESSFSLRFSFSFILFFLFPSLLRLSVLPHVFFVIFFTFSYSPILFCPSRCAVGAFGPRGQQDPIHRGDIGGFVRRLLPPVTGVALPQEPPASLAGKPRASHIAQQPAGRRTAAVQRHAAQSLARPLAEGPAQAGPRPSAGRDLAAAAP